MNTAMQIRPLALLLLAASSATAAFAQEGKPVEERLDPVEVKVQRHTPVTHLPRYDVERTCPDYAESLKTSLARSLAGNVDRGGEMLVTFELKGREVVAVSTAGGPFEYRRPVRRAVNRFDCAGDSQTQQRYMFQVVFKPDDGSGSSDDPRMAVRSGPQVLALAQASN